MFPRKTYVQRRKGLAERMTSGLAIFLGNEESAMNYPANAYPFRQDSSFLYYFGLDHPGLAAVVDIDENRTVLFGDDAGLEDIIWTGPQPRLKDRAAEIGIRETAPLSRLETTVKKAIKKKRTVHFLPPYRPGTAMRIGRLLGLPAAGIQNRASRELIKAVIEQRSIKSEEEIVEIEKALSVTSLMYEAALSSARTARTEREVAGVMEGVMRALGGSFAFPPIVTVNGHIFHNTFSGNILKKGRVLVMDCGSESELHYASDITRSIPVGGKFNRRQKDIYEIVLEAQIVAIRSVRAGVRFLDTHRKAARTIAGGLKDLGLMRGDADAAVEKGAHALFFPHGLGHQLGLDVHDMENLGENYVGYDDSVQRSGQFGLAYLRMAKELKPGHVMTIEPGIYFIPALYQSWKKGKKFVDFINYGKVESFLDFGGIRIEDDVLITKKGCRLLGPPIAKTPGAIEKAAASSS